MNEKILVVDDEKEIAEVIALYLRNEGYEVEVAHTGLEALKKVEENPPKLARGIDRVLGCIGILCFYIVKGLSLQGLSQGGLTGLTAAC